MGELLYKEITHIIIGAAYKVFNTLGSGFLEKVYENALFIELESTGLIVEQQVPIKVRYNGTIVGEYFADMLVENKVIVELKAVNELNHAHEVQLVNYLHATGVRVGLLINFGEELTIHRKIV